MKFYETIIKLASNWTKNIFISVLFQKNNNNNFRCFFFLIKIFHTFGYYYLVMTLFSFFFSFFWESSNDLTSSVLRCYDLLNDSYDALGLHCAWLELERSLCLGGEWLMSLSRIGNHWKWLTRSNLGLYNFRIMLTNALRTLVKNLF